MKLEKEIIEYAYSSLDSATVDGLSSGIGSPHQNSLSLSVISCRLRWIYRDVGYL